MATKISPRHLLAGAVTAGFAAGSVNAAAHARRLCLVLVLCTTLMLPAAWGQEFRGKIQGLVTDASEAVIPGATVTLLNIKTGIQTVKVTNETGLYRFDNVDPGSYTLTTDMPGFSKIVQENLTVQAQGGHHGQPLAQGRRAH